MGKKAAEGVEIHDDPELFPELDPKNAKHKELAKRLKRFEADKGEHAEAIDTLKQQMDESEESALALMNELELPKVRVNGKIYELRQRGERIAIKKVKEREPDEPQDD